MQLHIFNDLYILTRYIHIGNNLNLRLFVSSVRRTGEFEFGTLLSADLA